MGYLGLAILCSASIALLFKRSETSGLNRYAVTAVNYAVASLVSAALLALDPPAFDWTGAWGSLGATLARGQAPLPSGSALWSVLVGVGAGACFFLAFIQYQLGVRDHGAGLAGAFIKLGILVPMALSLVVWEEYPTALQWGGITLAVGSIVLVNWPGRGAGRDAVKPALLLLFAFGGLAEFSNKAFQRYALLDDRALFLLVTFAVAFGLSAWAARRRSAPVTRRDLAMGALVGVPNLFSSFFLILALNELPAAVAFPAFGAGSILLINVAGFWLFRERLQRREQLAVGLTILALVLMNY